MYKFFLSLKSTPEAHSNYVEGNHYLIQEVGMYYIL